MRTFGARTKLTLAAAALVALSAATAVWAQAQGEWKAPAEAKAMKNPEKGVGDAKKVIDANCVPCHGTSGKGDGPAAAALPTKPADWTSDKVQKESDGEIFWTRLFQQLCLQRSIVIRKGGHVSVLREIKLRFCESTLLDE